MTLDPSKPPADSFRTQNLAHSVAEELGPIFAASAGRELSSTRGSRVRTLGPTARRSGLSIATVGAVVAAGLVGLSLGQVFGRGGPQAKALAALAPSAASTEAPLAQAAAAPVAAAAQPQDLAVRGASKAAADVRRVHVLHRRAVRKPALVAAHVGACGGLRGEARAWCSHRAVMAADDRLRRAYDRAIGAGVARPVLASYRARWANLRDRASASPGEVVAGYSAMANDLSRIAATRRRAGGRMAHAWWAWG